MDIPAPFPYMGGKRRVASDVWARFGDVRNYVEPFFGSGAVLFCRPDGHEWWEKTETVNDADGMVCLAPETRVLRGDLRWIPIGELVEGDELVAFDECNGEPREGLRAPKRYRHWRLTTVIRVGRTTKPCYRLTFDDGTTVIASEDHQWLGGSHKAGSRGWRWQTTKGLVANRKTQASWILKLCDVQDQECTYESGWLAGFLDGEGHISDAPGWRLGFSQKLSPELERAVRGFTDRGYTVRRDARPRGLPHHSDQEAVWMTGGMKDVLRFLMQVRPERLIAKLSTMITSMSLYGRAHQAVRLVGKEYIGEREVVAIETDSHTFVAEGLASHNCNFWRAVQAQPEEVARWADWPVSECDLHARHAWLKGQREDLTRRLEGDSEFCDAKVAGWWVWATCQWIGTGFCSEDGNGPWVVEGGELVCRPGARGQKRKRPHLGDAGRGIHRQRPHLGDAGRGIHRKLPHLGDAGKGNCDAWAEHLRTYMQSLADRLRRVRVCCGDWSRVCGPTPTISMGLTGVFLDPPYSLDERDPGCYATDRPGIASDVRQWCIEHGGDERLRIALCGYAGEGHEPLVDAGWTEFAWKAGGGYSTQRKSGVNDNKRRERIWFSPHCLAAEAEEEDGVPAETGLFAKAAG